MTLFILKAWLNNESKTIISIGNIKSFNAQVAIELHIGILILLFNMHYIN